MKKNFFKKLSFVLALAMIVTALAPAAGAFAAKAPKLNASSKYLYLGVDKKDEFDFNISNKVKGWKYLWTTANDDVVSINKKNGLVTAEAAGKTKVSVVITDKSGEEVDELTATVTVRDNIKTLTLTNLPTDGKVAVGVAHDFNRSYVTVANKTKGSQAITRWSVEPKDSASITDMGVFTATKAGEYTITARAFQSKSKYTSWLTDATKYASYVTSNEATYKVTVAASMVSAKQVNLKKFDLAFDSAMTKEDITKNLVVYYVLGGTKVKETVKGVSMSADSKTATIEMNNDFTKGTTYVVEYPNMKSVEFVSATTKVEDVVDMAIVTKTAQLAKEQKLDIALLNKDGVNIANDDLKAKVTVEKADNNWASLSGKSLWMHKIGEVVKLTATYHTYNWKDGKEIGNVTATGEVTCVEVVKDAAGNIYGWSVQDITSIPTNFNTPKTSTFKGANPQLYVVLKGKNSSGDDMYTANYTGYPNATQGPLAWKYTSSNTSVLMVDPSTGRLYGVKEGSATVVVSYNDVQVGACEITVAGARKAAMATLSAQNITLSNKFSDNVDVTYEVKDQFGDDYKLAGVSTYNATSVITPNASYTLGNEPAITYGTNKITFNAFNKVAGTYNYTVKVIDSSDSNVSIPLNLTVTIQDPGTNLTTAYYQIEADKSSYDVKSGSTLAGATANLAVYEYNTAGVKLNKLTIAQLEGMGSTVIVRNPSGNSVTASAISGSAIINGSSQIVLAGSKVITVSGTTRNIAATEKTGSWVITASNTNVANGDKPVTAVGFEVKSTQGKVSYALKGNGNITDKYTSTVGAVNVAGIINECISFTVNDKTLTVEAAFMGTDYYALGKNITLGKIKIYEQIGSTSYYIEHEVDLGGMLVSIK